MTPSEFVEIRKRLGLSIAEIAEKLRLDPRTIRRYEAGDRKVPGPVMALLDIFTTSPPKR